MEEWKKQYRKMLEDENITYQQIREFISQYIPKKLYRYREFDEYYMDNVKGQVFLSFPCKFNDPFDSAIEIDYTAYTQMFFKERCHMDIPKEAIEEILRNYPGISEEFEKHYHATYKDFQEYVRIACFTTSYKNRLMWSHYADEHSGFCIEYDMSVASAIRDVILPVIYDKQRFDCTKILLEHSGNLAINPVFYKDKIWEYEKEWRTYGTKDYFEKNNNPLDVSNAISAIYLGAKSEEHSYEEEEIKRYALNKKIPVYKMEMSKSRYNLEPKRIL